MPERRLVVPTSWRTAEWQPRADLCRTASGWILKFDLAGVRREDVSVTLHGSRVTVSGMRRDWMLEEGSSYYFMEIDYNRFERTVELPCEIPTADVKLEFHEGILIVRLETQR